MEEISEQPHPPQWHAKSPAGGSLTVIGGEHPRYLTYLGAIASLGLPILVGLHKETSPTYTETAQKLYEYWKDTPWKGDVKVRIKPATIKEDIAAYWSLLGKDPKQGTFVQKYIDIPQIVLDNIVVRLFRPTHYNPNSHSVTLFDNNLYAGMHELGHALDFDPMVSKWKETHKQQTKGYMKSRLHHEWQASANAMTQLRTDQERREGMKVLEPAYGTYLGYTVGKLATYAFYLAAIGTVALNPALLPAGWVAASLGVKLLAGASVAFGVWLRSEQIGVLGAFLGAAGGRLISRLKNRQSAFGYVFEGKESSYEEALRRGQVHYAFARAPSI